MLPNVEIYYAWYEFRTVEGEEKPRLLVPHADPMEYETAIDFMFKTPEEAYQGLIDWDVADEARENGWILCKVTKQPIEVCK